MLGEKRLAGEDWGEEVVRREWYAARPSLEEIFEGKEADEAIYEAFYRWGYKPELCVRKPRDFTRLSQDIQNKELTKIGFKPLFHLKGESLYS